MMPQKCPTINAAYGIKEFIVMAYYNLKVLKNVGCERSQKTQI